MCQLLYAELHYLAQLSFLVLEQKLPDREEIQGKFQTSYKLESYYGNYNFNAEIAFCASCRDVPYMSKVSLALEISMLKYHYVLAVVMFHYM